MEEKSIVQTSESGAKQPQSWSMLLTTIVIAMIISGGFFILTFYINKSVAQDFREEMNDFSKKLIQNNGSYEELDLRVTALNDKVERELYKPHEYAGISPEWLTYSDQDISFQYPKTFCGTSWQAEWDSFSCDQDWEVERTAGNFSSSEYAGGEKNLTGDYIQILPSYSSFGFEFGGDIQIIFVTQEKFNNGIAGKNFNLLATDKGNKIYVPEKTNQYGEFESYFLTNDATYLIINNNFPGKYPEYIKFLLESIDLK
jgi:hypothetical protein